MAVRLHALTGEFGFCFLQPCNLYQHLSLVRSFHLGTCRSPGPESVLNLILWGIVPSHMYSGTGYLAFRVSGPSPELGQGKSIRRTLKKQALRIVSVAFRAINARARHSKRETRLSGCKSLLICSNFRVVVVLVRARRDSSFGFLITAFFSQENSVSANTFLLQGLQLYSLHRQSE